IAADRDAKGANGQKLQAQQRVSHALGMQTVGGQQGARDCQQSQYLAAAQGRLAEHLEHIGKQSNSRDEQDQPDDIERIIALLAIVGQMPVDQYQAAQADWNVDKKNHPPRKYSMISA